jgi:hypothetical protein
MVLGCGGILHRERIGRKRELRGLSEATLAPRLLSKSLNRMYRKIKGKDAEARPKLFGSDLSG